MDEENHSSTMDVDDVQTFDDIPSDSDDEAMVEKQNDGSEPGINLRKEESVYLRNHDNSLLKADIFETCWSGSYDSTNFSWEELAKTIFGSKGLDIVNTRRGGSDADNSSPPPLQPKQSKLLFADCGGLEKQIGFLRVALFGPLSKENFNYERYGLEPPKGILFHGPPGTGKTRLAEAIGNEIERVVKKKVHFIHRKGQDVASKFFGQSSENLRNVFQEAILFKPTVLFFDEMDGLCPNRDRSTNQENVTIVTTMLGLMDDLPVGEVFVIGATNRLDAVDPALRRPGRFDKYLEFQAPDEKGRHDILRIHTKSWKIKPTDDTLQEMSRRTPRYSGADLAKLCLDSFDHALQRRIGDSDDFWEMDFSDLKVEYEDWNKALQKIRPSIRT